MSYLNQAEDWERFQAEQPMLAAAFAIPGCLFVPPPGVDARQAYTQIFAACVAIWLHIALIGCAIS